MYSTMEPVFKFIIVPKYLIGRNIYDSKQKLAYPIKTHKTQMTANSKRNHVMELIAGEITSVPEENYEVDGFELCFLPSNKFQLRHIFVGCFLRGLFL